LTDLCDKLLQQTTQWMKLSLSVPDHMFTVTIESS